MKRGTPVLVKTNDSTLSGTIVKAVHASKYTVNVNNKTTEFQDSQLYPTSVEGFVNQQMNILNQVVHFTLQYNFANPYEFEHTFGERVICKPLEDESFCASFFCGKYLALFTEEIDDSFPFAFLNPVDSCLNGQVKTIHTLGKERFKLPTIGKCKYIKIIHNDDTFIFLNSIPIYSLPMGKLFLLTNCPPFQRTWSIMCFELASFAQSHRSFAYEPLQRMCFYESDDNVHHLCSILSGIENFIICNKSGFTLHRFAVYDSIDMLSDYSAHKSTYPIFQTNVPLQYLSAIDFLHTQYLFAMHLLEFIHSNTDAKTLEKWNVFSELCGQIFIRLEQCEREQKYQWKPSFAMNGLRKYPANKEFVLNDDFLRMMVQDREHREAYLSLFQYIIKAYAEISEKTTIISEEKIDDYLYLVEGCLVPCLCVDPQWMQVRVLHFEKTSIRDSCFEFMQDHLRIESRFGLFYPKLEDF